MRQLLTIQKQDKLNNVYAVDEEGPGGANHVYLIEGIGNDDVHTTITFQKGPRKMNSSVHGVLNPDLLEIVRDRLTAFQAGPFASEYTADALEHVEAALDALNRRVEDRAKRGVLGKNEK